MKVWFLALIAAHASLNGMASSISAGAPVIRFARPENVRVVLSFTPVEGATSYEVLCSSQAETRTLSEVLVTDYTVHGLQNGTAYRFQVAALGPWGKTAFSSPVKATPTAEMSWADLEAAFSGANPTRSTCPLWTLHGRETDAELRQFLQVAYQYGFEGVTVQPYDFEDYLGEGQWHRWRVIVEEARRLGLAVWQLDDRDYPSGWAGGYIARKDRKLARWEITLPSSRGYQGPGQFSWDIASELPSHQQLVSVAAFGSAGRVEDLTDHVSAGWLQWSGAPGRWEIFLVAAWQPGMDDPATHPDHRHGQERGYIDPLSEQATDMYVETIMGATFRNLGSEFGRTWKGFFIDEPGFLSSGSTLGTPGVGYPYTPDFLDRFQQRFGYSLRPLLPLLWITRGEQTLRVRHDYMEFVTGEYGRLFVGKQTRFAEEHGVQLIGHLIEGPPMAREYGVGRSTGSTVRTLGHFSMGGFDSIFDQWNLPDEDVYWRQPKIASSISHQIGTPLDEAMVEHFAATGWRTGLTEMKAMVDWTTCRGLNRIVPSGIDSQDPPVWENTPELWLRGRNPLVPYMREYQVAVNRQTMLIRGGRHVARALLLDPVESAWGGSSVELWKACKALSQAHFDYDITTDDVFIDPARCTIKDKRVLLGREEYEFVVMPSVFAAAAPLLRRLQEFCEAGGTVIWLGSVIRLDPVALRVAPRLPVQSPDGRNSAEVRDLGEKLLIGAGSVGRNAHMLGYRQLTNFLYSLDAHDVWIDPNLSMLQYYHRRVSGRDLYFINNEGERVRTEVRLRGVRGVPELWDPVTGRICQAPCYRREGKWLSVRLNLERYESIFIVINPDAVPLPHLIRTDADEARRLDDGGLELRKQAPGFFTYALARSGSVEEKCVATPAAQLEPLRLEEGWSRTPKEGNGAVYRIRFDWTPAPGTAAELRLDKMTQWIAVRLNGETIGTRFAYPFRFDLGVRLQSGQNNLELEHVERHTFESHLGEVRLIPFYRIRI